MRTYRILSYKYGIDISMLAERRFPEGTFISGDEFCAEVCTKSVSSVALALCNMILCDLSQLEIADLVNEIPAPYSVRRSILISAIDLADRASLFGPVLSGLENYLRKESMINIEGYIRFRMRDTAEIWERCVDRAAEDIILHAESEAMRALFRVINNYRLCVIVNKDASYTLIDEGGAYVDFPCGREENVMSIILSLSPVDISVFDRSQGKADEMICALRKTFPQIVHPVYTE